MEWQQLAMIMGAVLAVALILGQWTAMALGSTGLLLLWIARGETGISSVGSVIWNTANSYVLIAVLLWFLSLNCLAPIFTEQRDGSLQTRRLCSYRFEI